MFKLGMQLLLSRKKWLLLMVLSLSLMIAASTSVFTASESIKAALKNVAFNVYGEHSGVLIEVNESKENIAQKVERVGQYEVIHKIKFGDNKIATVGWMDQDAIEIGRIVLAEGTIPTLENEVAIESSYLKLIDRNWEIGQEKQLNFGSEKKIVKLSGIIKDYSSQWSVPIEVEKGVNDFPNIIVKKGKSSIEKDSANFLFKFEGRKDKIEQKTNQLLEEYNSKGFINSRLFNTGLIDYDTISSLSFIFQLLIFVSSIFCIANLFSYFNKNQNKKMGIMKAVGANRNDIYKIYFFQCLSIFLLSILLALPFQVLFHFLIINRTYNIGEVENIHWIYILGAFLSWIIFTFFVVFLSSIVTIEKAKKESVNELLKEKVFNPILSTRFTEKIKSFNLRQLYIQLFSYPKQLVFTILTLCLSVLIIMFSIFLQRESAGIWDGEEDYFLSSQEIYGFDSRDQFNVLLNKGLTFSEDDVRKLENHEGISHISKKPFMLDVHPLISLEHVPTSIQAWVKQQGEIDSTYKNQLLIPNVQYIIVNQKEFEEIYSEQNYNDFVGKALLFVPHITNEEEKILIGNKISFIKKFLKEDSLETKEWEYNIFDIINEPIPGIQEFTIILDVQTALDNGIFPGYNELTIYTEKNLTTEQSNELETLIYDLVVTVPGSFFQNVSDFLIEDRKISYLVGYLGILTFITAICLSLINIIVLVFSKYNTQKKHWGIYLSLGMSKKQVLVFLTIEMLIYFMIASMLSLVIFIFVINLISHIYSVTYYLQYYVIVNSFILILIIIGSLALRKIIKNQSIYSLIRSEE